MARAERAIPARGTCHRQEHAGLPDATFTDDYRPIVHRILEARHEDAVQELFAHCGVDFRTSLDELIECGASLERHQCADALLCEGARRLDDLFDGLGFLRGALAPQERTSTHSRERAPDVRLEDDDDDHGEVRKYRVENRRDGDETDPTRQEIADEYEAEANRHLHRTRASKNDERPINEDGYEANVEAIMKHRERRPLEEANERVAHVGEHAGEHLDHDASPRRELRALATATTCLIT